MMATKVEKVGEEVVAISGRSRFILKKPVPPAAGRMPINIALG